MITGLVAIAAGLVFSHPVHAAAPMQKGQAPGFYRWISATSRSSNLLRVPDGPGLNGPVRWRAD